MLKKYCSSTNENRARTSSILGRQTDIIKFSKLGAKITEGGDLEEDIEHEDGREELIVEHHAHDQGVYQMIGKRGVGHYFGGFNAELGDSVVVVVVAAVGLGPDLERPVYLLDEQVQVFHAVGQHDGPRDYDVSNLQPDEGLVQRVGGEVLVPRVGVNDQDHILGHDNRVVEVGQHFHIFGEEGQVGELIENPIEVYLVLELQE